MGRLRVISTTNLKIQLEHEEGGKTGGEETRRQGEDTRRGDKERNSVLVHRGGSRGANRGQCPCNSESGPPVAPDRKSASMTQ